MLKLSKLPVLQKVFITYSLIACILGCCVMGLGAYMQSQRYWNFDGVDDPAEFFGYLPIFVHGANRENATWAMIGCGLGLMFVGVGGLSLLFKKTRVKSMHLLHLFLMAILTASSLFMFNHGLYHGQTSTAYFQSGLHRSLQSYGVDKTIQDWWDAVQQRYECCAVDSYTDYRLISWYKNNGPVEPLKRNPFTQQCAPKSCCFLDATRVNEMVGEKDPKKLMNNLMAFQDLDRRWDIMCYNVTMMMKEACEKNFLEDYYEALNPYGCFDALKSKFEHSFSEPKLIMGISMAMCLTMIVGCILDIINYYARVKSHKQALSLAVAAAKYKSFQNETPEKY